MMRRDAAKEVEIKDATADGERSNRESKQHEQNEDQREMEKRKRSRKNSFLLDKILLTNTASHENRSDNEMFYHEPSVNYVGAFE